MGALILGLPVLPAAVGGSNVGDGPSGVVVEQVDKASSAERAGLLPEDVIVSWSRAAAPPANPQAARGVLASPFDLKDVEIEQAPRGPVTLVGSRHGAPVTWTFKTAPFGLTARPVLEDDLLAAYREGRRLIQAGQVAEGAAQWRGAAAQGKERGHALADIWLTFQAAKALADGKAWPEADQAHEDAAQKAQAALPPPAAAQILRRWTDTLRDRSEWARADVAQRRAQALDESAGAESLAVAADIHGLGRTKWEQRDIDGAEAYFKRALALRETLAPGSIEASASLNNMGVIASQREDLDAAQDYYERAVRIQEELTPDSSALASTLGNLGVTAATRGDLDKAEEYSRRCLALEEKLGLDISRTLSDLATLAHVRGELANAEQLFRRALAIREGQGPDSFDSADILHSLGLLMHERGDLDAAEEHLQRSLAMAKRLAPESRGQVYALVNLGLLARDRGDLAKAEEHCRAALVIEEKVAPGRLTVAMILGDLAGIAALRGDRATAEQLYGRALAVEEALAPGALDTAQMLIERGNLAVQTGDAGAEEYYRRALAIVEKLAPASNHEAKALHGLAEVSRRGGRLEAASGLFLRALEALEGQRAKLGGRDDARAGFTAKYAAYYHDAIEALIASGRSADAIHVLERSRARSLVSLLAERNVAFAADLPPKLAEERKRADAEYDRVQSKLAGLDSAKDSAEVQALLARLRELRHVQGEVAGRVREASPHYASLHYPEPLDLAGIRRALDPGTVLLAYSVGAEKTVLFTVQSGEVPGPGLFVASLPIGEKALREKVEALRQAILKRPGRRAVAEHGAELYDLLIRPAEALAAAGRRLVLSLDGPLHSLPFAALTRREAGKVAAAYLVEWKPLHVIASASVHAELKRSRHDAAASPGPLVAFGDPLYPALSTERLDAVANPELRDVDRSFALSPLPATRQEVAGIARLFPGRARTYVGGDATEERAKALGKDARYVHFACHGYLDERFPLNSGLALTIPKAPAEGQDNGLLQAWEIFDRVRIEADLLVLSACNTGLGKELGGEGLLGLTRAFHYAGARSVLGTLWAVSDHSTPLLMERFYAHLKAGLSHDEALRAAQIDFIRGRGGLRGRVAVDLADPFRWAAFQLSGDWR